MHLNNTKKKWILKKKKSVKKHIIYNIISSLLILIFQILFVNHPYTSIIYIYCSIIIIILITHSKTSNAN